MHAVCTYQTYFLTYKLFTFKQTKNRFAADSLIMFQMLIIYLTYSVLLLAFIVELQNSALWMIHKFKTAYSFLVKVALGLNFCLQGVYTCVIWCSATNCISRKDYSINCVCWNELTRFLNIQYLNFLPLTFIHLPLLMLQSTWNTKHVIEECRKIGTHVPAVSCSWWGRRWIARMQQKQAD